jgi:low temperature requirement protein LtrA
VAGIIAIAAADELTVAHPGEHGTLASVALTLGGTALFLAGHTFFEWAMFGVHRNSTFRFLIAYLLLLDPRYLTRR